MRVLLLHLIFTLPGELRTSPGVSAHFDNQNMTLLQTLDLVVHDLDGFFNEDNSDGSVCRVDVEWVLAVLVSGKRRKNVLLVLAGSTVHCTVFQRCQPPQYTVNHPIFDAHNDFLKSQNELLTSQNTIMEQMTQLTSMCELGCQIVQKKQEEKRIEEEQAASARYWKIPAYEVIKSSVEDLVPILSESEGILDTMCDVHFVNNPTPLEAKDQVEIVINSNDDISSKDDDPDDIDDIFKIEGNLFDFETPMCEAFNDFNHLLKTNKDLFTFDIQGTRTYEEYELNNHVTRDIKES
nr:hypothetical protein [Tanacetum cinerariifolium]